MKAGFFCGINPNMIIYLWLGSHETSEDRWSPGDRAQGARRPDFHNSNQDNMLPKLVPFVTWTLYPTHVVLRLLPKVASAS